MFESETVGIGATGEHGYGVQRKFEHPVTGCEFPDHELELGRQTWQKVEGEKGGLEVGDVDMTFQKEYGRIIRGCVVFVCKANSYWRLACCAERHWMDGVGRYSRG